MNQQNQYFDKLYDFIGKQGLKKTHQRDVIATIFFSKPHRHYRIEDILEKSREKDKSISYATVYRTLMMFVEAGLAEQRQFGKGQSRFELVDRHHHDHIICTSCGRIDEFENDKIEELQEAEARRLGYALTSHKMELYGLCQTCSNKRKK